MKEVSLTREQIDEIEKRLSFAEGEIYEEFEFDDMFVQAEGFLKTSGYAEKETNAWIETYRYANVELSAWVYNPVTEDEDEVEICAEDVAEINEFLNAA